ncbi:MAG: ABC transporter ATP-binding protein [Veillonellales bacterium]
MTALVLRGLYKQYSLHGQPVNALTNVNLTVEHGSFVTIVGRSGCGKTTLLRVIGGLESLSAGQIIFTPPGTKVGMVFQEPRLMPWLTVEQNMALGMGQAAGKEKVRQTTSRFLAMLGLTSFKNAYPDQLSGGMAQRAALGRVLCYDPDIILLDEPLSALDAFTRRNLQKELVNIFRTQQKTILFVTHDVDEALLLGQRVLIMENGGIVGEFTVSFPYPRNSSGEDFYRLREELLGAIQGGIE